MTKAKPAVDSTTKEDVEKVEQQPETDRADTEAKYAHTDETLNLFVGLPVHFFFKVNEPHSARITKVLPGSTHVSLAIDCHHEKRVVFKDEVRYSAEPKERHWRLISDISGEG